LTCVGERHPQFSAAEAVSIAASIARPLPVIVTRIPSHISTKIPGKIPGKILCKIPGLAKIPDPLPKIADGFNQTAG
jgi:hypothetical protein